MGGTAALLAASGAEVLLLDVTDGEPTPFGSKEIRAKESKVAADLLGIKNRRTLEHTNREIFDSVALRKHLAGIMREFRPELLFLPYWEDRHPDHVQVFNASVAASFYAKFVKTDMPGEPHYPRKTFHYFSTHLRIKYTPSFLVDVSATIDKKFAALAAYESQFGTSTKNAEFMDALKAENRYWGFQIGTTYAEPFICREHLKVHSADALFQL